MSDNQNNPLQKEADFQWLIQPLDSTRMAELEEYIVNNNVCRDTIKIWKGLIVDGYEKYDICVGYGVAYETEDIDLPDKIAVMEYICTIQLKRGDLTDEYFKYLIGKKLSLRSAMEMALTEGMDSFAVRQQANKSRGINQKYAEETGFATVTVRKYREFSDAIDAIRKKQPDMAAIILRSELKVSHESIVEISRMPKEEVQYLYDVIKKENKRRLRFSEIHEELRWKYSSSFSRGIRKKEKTPEIRKMPKYDPDAEISSLALTIPSWISSIERAAERTNFEKITPQASERLKEQLHSLQSMANKVGRYLKEG